MENLRFHLEEEKKVKGKDGTKREATKADIEKFAMALSKFGDVYVNDAFGTMHRAHTSITDIKLPMKVAGLLVKKELEAFAPLLSSDGNRPIDVLILGGAKVADKIKLIDNLLPKVKTLLVGGGMAFTFLKKKGVEIGKSIFDADGFQHLDDLLEKAKELGVQIILPADYIISADGQSGKTCQGDIPDGFSGMDIGPETSARFAAALNQVKANGTILWNGPVGVFEREAFSAGTRQLTSDLAEATAHGVKTVVGGGDSAAAAAIFAPHSLGKDFFHVSTGGGASLELLEGIALPGIAVLSSKQ